MLMSRMYHEAPKEYKFYPETWVLPAEMGDFRCVVWCGQTTRTTAAMRSPLAGRAKTYHLLPPLP